MSRNPISAALVEKFHQFDFVALSAVTGGCNEMAGIRPPELTFRHPPMVKLRNGVFLIHLQFRFSEGNLERTAELQSCMDIGGSGAARMCVWRFR